MICDYGDYDFLFLCCYRVLNNVLILFHSYLLFNFYIFILIIDEHQFDAGLTSPMFFSRCRFNMNYMCCQRVQVSLPVLSLQCLIVSFIGLALLVVIFIALLETNHSWHHSQQAQLADNPKFSKTLPYIPIETDTSDESLYYGIVIDCGSSGSRVYVYFWPKHSGNSSDLLNIQQLTDSNREAVVKKVTPGKRLENNC